MFDWAKAGWSKLSCRTYSARLEDYAELLEGSPAEDSKLDAHLRGCAQCRQALDDALLTKELLRPARVPALDPSERLMVRVMASIHEEMSRRATETIWRPLELLASKFALVAAMVLLLLGAYLAKSTQRFAPPPTSQNEIGSVMPEPPSQPSGPDEIVMSLTGAEAQ